MKKLIVTADDFGLTERVNEAICKCFREGIVTTASLMTSGAAFDSAVEIARNNPELDVGIHLNLTEGQDFAYRHPAKLAIALLLGQVSSGDLEKTIRGQIEKALLTGLQITHIDGHKHVHAIPTVRRIIERVGPEYGVHAIRSVVESVPSLPGLLRRNPGSRRRILLQYGFGRALSAIWRTTATGPVRFYGITQTGFLDEISFTEIIDDLRDGIHEVMCHPGYVDDALKKTPTRLLYQREREVRLLTAPRIKQMLEERNIILGSYRDLVQNTGTTNLWKRQPRFVTPS